MIEDRTLIRDIVEPLPDGTSIHRSEVVEVQLRHPEKGWPKEEPKSEWSPRYGDWRLLPKSM